jgi:hypothetical protein
VGSPKIKDKNNWRKLDVGWDWVILEMFEKKV